MRIVIIDDHAKDRARTVHLLQESLATSELVEVADRLAYEQAIADGPVDLILTDYTVSWANGPGLLGELQSRLPGVPVIMVSGAGDERIAVEGMKAGVSDYIPKAHLDLLPDAVGAVLTTTFPQDRLDSNAPHSSLDPPPAQTPDAWSLSAKEITDFRNTEAEHEQLIVNLEEQAGQLNAVLESIADAVIVYNPQGEILRMNAAAERLAEHRGWGDALPLRSHPRSWQLLDASGETCPPEALPMMRALQGETVRAELHAVQRGDRQTPLWVTISAAPILSAAREPRGAVATITDVTSLMQMQHQLEDANAYLEEQTAELEEQGEELRSQAEELRVSSDNLAMERSRLQAILGALPVAVLIADREGHLIELNDHARAMWGLQGNPVTCAQLYAERIGWWTDSGDAVQADEWAMTRALHSGETRTSEMIDIERSDGTRATILKSAAPIRDGDGNITGAVGICLDITEHRRLEDALTAERGLLQSIYDTAPVMFAVYDPQIEQVTLNKHVERVTGWTEADTAETNIMELVYPDPDYRAEVAAYMQSLRPGFKDIQMVTKSGETIETSWANIQLSDGRQVGIGLDISDHKRAEAVLAEYAEELEQLNQTNQMLLREVNHRVKNNLTAILGLIQAEKRRLPAEMDVAAQGAGSEGSVKMSAVMDDLAQRVSSLATVHSLLSASGWRPLRVDTLAGQVIEAATPAAKDVRKLVVNVRPSAVHITPTQAHHVALVIGELVTNSVKYGCCDGELRITLESVRDDDQVRLIYRDSGTGYPSEVLAGQIRSVGLGLLNSIVGLSLRGDWSIRNDNGAVTELRFPLGQ